MRKREGACAGNYTCAGGTEKMQVMQELKDIPKRREDGRTDSLWQLNEEEAMRTLSRFL